MRSFEDGLFLCMLMMFFSGGSECAKLILRGVTFPRPQHGENLIFSEMIEKFSSDNLKGNSKSRSEDVTSFTFLTIKL